MNTILRTVLKNLGVALVTIAPIWMGGWLLIGYLAGAGSRLDAIPTDTLFYVLVLAPSILLGGALQQSVIALTLKYVSRRGDRPLMVASTVLIPMTLVALGSDPDVVFAPESAVPLAAGLVVCGLLQRSPVLRAATTPRSPV